MFRGRCGPMDPRGVSGSTNLDPPTDVQSELRDHQDVDAPLTLPLSPRRGRRPLARSGRHHLSPVLVLSVTPVFSDSSTSTPWSSFGSGSEGSIPSPVGLWVRSRLFSAEGTEMCVVFTPWTWGGPEGQTWVGHPPVGPAPGPVRTGMSELTRPGPQGPTKGVSG